jgi:hypothetical protein
MPHLDEKRDERDGHLRQVRLALGDEDHLRLRILAAQMDRTYSEIVALGLVVLAQQRSTP